MCIGYDELLTMQHILLSCSELIEIESHFTPVGWGGDDNKTTRQFINHNFQRNRGAKADLNLGPSFTCQAAFT